MNLQHIQTETKLTTIITTYTLEAYSFDELVTVFHVYTLLYIIPNGINSKKF